MTKTQASGTPPQFDPFSDEYFTDPYRPLPADA